MIQACVYGRWEDLSDEYGFKRKDPKAKLGNYLKFELKQTTLIL